MPKTVWTTDTIDGPDVSIMSWPEAWPLPQLADTVVNQKGARMIVREVIWEPFGGPDPFVHIVVDWHR